MVYSYEVNQYFDLRKTLECGQCFHFEKLDEYKYKVYGLNTICIIEQNNTKVNIVTDSINFWKHYFSLDVNYTEIYEYLINFAKKQKDDFALKSLEEGKGIVILKQPFFETCCSYILSQQNNIPRIRKMIFELSSRYSKDIVFLDDVKEYCFPRRKDLLKASLEDLKDCGLGYRAEYIYEFVRNFEGILKGISFEYEKDKELLKTCKGIGEKVANCICLYGLHELDAFPIDIWMKRVITEEYENKGKEFILPQKYRGVLQQCMYYFKREKKD